MISEKSKSIRVDLKHAEKVRKYLSKIGLLRDDLEIFKDNQFIYFPIKGISKGLTKYTIVEKEFIQRKIKPSSYKDLIYLPKSLINILPNSYDIIGNIALVKLSDALLEYYAVIGDSLISTNKNIKAVFQVEPVSGELRTRKIRLISGIKNTETVHKEYGLQFEVDVKKTYFSPRLANERKRVSSIVKPGETVVDMFAGVAPFSIMIAKYANPKIVYAIDKNKDAIKFAKKNILKNKVLDKVEVIHADAKDTKRIFKERNVMADRIIMNLPFSACDFFKNALEISSNISIIHHYDIANEGDIRYILNKLKEIAEGSGFSLEKLKVKKIKSYSPREFYIGIDITAKKKT